MSRFFLSCVSARALRRFYAVLLLCLPVSFALAETVVIRDDDPQTARLRWTSWEDLGQMRSSGSFAVDFVMVEKGWRVLSSGGVSRVAPMGCEGEMMIYPLIIVFV